MVRRMLDQGLFVGGTGRQRAAAAASPDTGPASMERALANYDTFPEPKTVLSLRSQVVGAEATLGYQTTRLNREQERLEHYQKLLDSCTIRATDDGYVVYANSRGRDPQVYEALSVASE